MGKIKLEHYIVENGSYGDPWVEIWDYVNNALVAFAIRLFN